LASLYQALENTIFTPSELTEYSYPGMRSAISSEMGSNSSATAALSDSALLDQYNECEYYDYSVSKVVEFFKFKYTSPEDQN
jgi:hypothetical protein